MAVMKLATSSVARADAGNYEGALKKQRELINLLRRLRAVPGLARADLDDLTLRFGVARENYGIYQRSARKFEASAETLKTCVEFARQNGMRDHHSKVLYSLARTYQDANKLPEMKHIVEQLKRLGKDTTGYKMSFVLQIFALEQPNWGHSSHAENITYAKKMAKLLEKLVTSVDNGTSCELSTAEIGKFVQMGIHMAQVAGNHELAQKFARRFLKDFEALCERVAAYGYNGPPPQREWSCLMCCHGECPVAIFEGKMKVVCANMSAE